ncbi:MAG: BadF/BadG/BcrA/BcrD ATPase family protein [Pseudomonadota bacterium]
MSDLLFLGVDAGGSRSRARLAAASGETLGEGSAGPGSLRKGADMAFGNISAAYDEAFAAAGIGLDARPRVAALFGVAGANRREERAAFMASPFPFEIFDVVSDAEIALSGAYGEEDGGVVIVGTGSIGLGRKGGAVFQVGGYGFPISDEGSGAHIGLQCIRRTLMAADRRAAPSDLTTAVFDEFGADIDALIAWMDTADATAYAAFAPQVANWAEAGDRCAEELMREAGEHIGAMVDALAERGAPACSLTGGLSERIYSWLPAGPQRRLRPARGTPLDGALALAQRLAAHALGRG